MPTALRTKPSGTPRAYVVDASVAVKWFSQEQGSVRARRILRDAQKRTTELFAPDLLYYEVGNALGKGKRLEGPLAREAMHVLLALPVTIVSLHASQIDQLVFFMDTYGLTFYDAAYAALAVELSAPLLSANPKDHGKIKELKLITL